jgi:hypothetical protein
MGLKFLPRAQFCQHGADAQLNSKPCLIPAQSLTRMSDFFRPIIAAADSGKARARIGRCDFSFIDDERFISKFSRPRQMTLPPPTQ